MSLEGYLDARDEGSTRAALQAERDAAARAWLRQDQPAEVRLLRFDGWVRRELEIELDWAWAGAEKERRIEQCRMELEGLVLALWRRGWLLDGARLAKHIRAALADVAAAQKAGRVKNFWMFFQSVVSRYVGINSEEIRAEAMGIGASVGDVFAMLKKTAPALPELVAQRRDETLREKLAKQRAKETAKKRRADQPQLF